MDCFEIVFFVVFLHVHFHISDENENHLIKFSKKNWSCLCFLLNHFDFSKKKIKGSPKNFTIYLIASKNRASKMIKFCIYSNLEIESNQNVF